jgi:sarcosine oxidase subunit gamma
MRDRFGLELPAPGTWVEAGGLLALSLAPDQFELQREGSRDVHAELAPALGAHGGLIGLSGARAIFRLGGANVREALSRLLPIDLHPRAFAPNRVAATIGAHIPLHLLQRDAAPIYHLACPRSYAASLRHALTVAKIEVA